jgi:hypothetical protein
MKKVIVLLISVFVFVGFVFGQEVLLNGTFESWDDPNTPTSWTHVENITQESTIVHGGTYSAQHIGGTKDIGQTIVVEPNTNYTIVIWYYVEAGDGSDARIWSFFQDVDDVRLADIPALLGPDNSYLPSDTSWQKYETIVTSPADAASLYFEVRTYSTATVYWDDMSVFHTVTDDPEPTNHVNGFTVTANGHDQIDLTWAETDGTQAPAGYLIKASTSDNITNPTDSTVVSDNATIGDDSGAKNISHGTTSYEWTGLDTETPYYFKIYPYTNSGSDIDYKTDGTIPSGNATTGVEPAAPTAGDLYITEVCGDGVDTGTDNGFMEIYNNSDHAISLRNVEARYYNTNPNDPSQIVVLSGEIDSSAFVIVTQNETNFNAAYTPVTAEFSGSNFYFNGGDDGCDIYYVTTTTILDKFNNNGVSATPWTWSDANTYERNSINSGADSLNWTEITSGIATPGATNSTPLSDDVSIKENYTKIADKYTLGRTYPNPFNPTFTIPLKLNKNAFVNIQLVNILGQKVLQIENSQMAVGNNDLQVNCENLNSGVYFVKATIDNVNNIQKVVLLK